MSHICDARSQICSALWPDSLQQNSEGRFIKTLHSFFRIYRYLKTMSDTSVWAFAIHDFEGELKDDLAFRRGDLLHVSSLAENKFNSLDTFHSFICIKSLKAHFTNKMPKN